MIYIYFMVLNYVWIGFIVVAFLVALCKLIFLGDTEVFSKIVVGSLDSAKAAALLAIGLTGVMTFWMGLMKVGENAGAVNFLSRIIGPVFRRLFPEIPNGHPAHGQIMLNFSANMLGLSNAATPMGLKAMASMQELTTEKERASNSMIMFLALNTAGFTLIPVSIMAIRGLQGAKDPTDVFVPILMTSFCTSMFALIFVALRQGIRIWEPKLLTFLVVACAFMFGIVRFFISLSSEQRADVSSVAGNMIIFGIVVAFLIAGMLKRQNVFEGFIEGAKDGFQTAVRIIPYLVGLIVAIGMFRASGAMDYVVAGCTWFFQQLGVDTRFTPALPVAFMKPLSGGGTESLAIDLMKANGADSFVGRMASVMYASADTTFYIVALYFGSIGVKRTRYAVGAGLLVDLAGITAAILFSYLFWG